MKNNVIIAALIVVTVAVVGFMAVGTQTTDRSAGNAAAVATVYKSPYCGCCGVYASYMEGNGYTVNTENTQEMEAVKERFGVPRELESCHTMELAGYVIEGHIPQAAIDKLLSEKPDIKGIGMAGMPSGSPGMPGPKNEPFTIYEITHDGTKGEVFMSI